MLTAHHSTIFFPQIFVHLSHDPASSECLDLLREYLVGKVSDHLLICSGSVQKSPQRRKKMRDRPWASRMQLSSCRINLVLEDI